MSLALRIGARSDVGLVRDGNEDSLYAGHHLLAVADGVGGAVAGEIASSLTIRSLEPLEHETPLDDPLGALRSAVTAANRRLRDRVDHDPALQGMGTTLTAMFWVRERFGLAQVGDSRAYLLRDGQLSQLTRDQTFVQLLLDEGRITPEQATTHPQRSVILNALDGRDDVEPDLSMRDVEVGDRYLLCSDGLSDYVARDDIAAGLEDPDPQQTCDRLVDLALEAGGPDNISCIIADVVADDEENDPRLPIVQGAAAEALAKSADGAADRPSDHEHRRPRSITRRLTVLAVIVVLLIAGAVAGTVAYIHSQWYVAAAEPSGTVAVYQGVSGKVLGVSLSHLRSPTNIPVTALPQDDAEQLKDGIETSSRSRADGIVTTLRSDACPTPSPAPTSTSSRHRSGSGQPKPAPVPPWCPQ